MRSTILSVLFLVSVVACGSHSGGSADAPGTGSDNDATTSGTGDAPFSGTCTPGGAQCSDCIDNDGDGLIDGFDPECTGPLDRSEASFATGIPGDNIDPVMQDCFFDGNSGAGNDGCNVHVCCLLGATTVAACPIGANRYNPADCPPPIGTMPLTQQCIDTCGKLAPPGCDCFGCCTICDPATSQCYDIDINPADSPNCNGTNIGDPAACLRCTKSTTCGNSTCGGTTCILCPGQTTLPPGCSTSTCPAGLTACGGANPTCATGTYCSNGCCIGTLQ